MYQALTVIQGWFNKLNKLYKRVNELVNSITSLLLLLHKLNFYYMQNWRKGGKKKTGDWQGRGGQTDVY